MFPLGDVDRDTFMREYWRKRPLFVKGGALKAGPALSRDRYRTMADRLAARHPDLVRHEGGLLACQNISAVDPMLGGWLAEVMREMSWTTAWVDAVLAPPDGGIGGHIDDSDNFILQQEGVKVWRLLDSRRLDQDLLRTLMMRAGPVDTSVRLPEDDSGIVEFRLEPGDLLYVPFLWGHWGVSEGDSLSMSLVCNAENPLGLLPLLHWVIGEDRDWWWAMPVPGVADLSPGAETRVPDEVRDLMRRLLTRLSEPAVVDELAGIWWENRVTKQRELAALLSSPAAGGKTA